MNLPAVLDRCRQICQDPDFTDAIRWKEDHPDGKVVGCFPVYTPAEIINQVTAGYRVEDILSGVHDSLAERVAAQMRRVGIQEEITVTGGVARNPGMVKALEDRLGVALNVDAAAEYAGALGAAILSGWRLEKTRRAA